MSETVKKAGSIFILSTYITSIALAITYFFGSEVLASRDGRIETNYVKQQMVDLKSQSSNLNAQMAEFIQYSHENRIILTEHGVRISNCEDDIEECKAGNP